MTETALFITCFLYIISTVHIQNQNKRHFRRYPRETDITLKFREKYFPAKMVNYSPGGIATVIEKRPVIGMGDVVEITADDPEIRIHGKVAWSVIEGSILSFGSKNILQLKGLTKDYNIADLLIGLQRGAKTGVLTIKGGDAVKKIYIKNGDIIFSASNHDEDRLGAILLREGKINKDQYDRSIMEMKKSSQRHGVALVRLGYISPHDLYKSVTNQVELIIESLFALEDGRFEFEEGPLPTEEVITLKLSAANIIYRGMKKTNSISIIQKKLHAEESVPSFATDPLDLFQDLRLDESGLKIISCVDGKTSVKDIISKTQISSVETLKTIYALLSVGIIELQEYRANFSGTHEDLVKEVHEAHKEEKEIKIDPMTQEIIEEMHRKCGRLDHYSVLEVKSNATVGEIKAAYYKAAKKYHPDMHFYLENDSFKDKLSKIFSRVYEAYRTLSDSRRRSEYDRMITTGHEQLTAVQNRGRDTFEEGKKNLKNNNYHDAERLFGQAIYFDRTIAEYHYHYGLTLIRLNKVKEAVKAFESARRIEPNNADYLSELGSGYLRLGYNERARRLFHKALIISPNNSKAVEGLKKIKEFLSR